MKFRKLFVMIIVIMGGVNRENLAGSCTGEGVKTIATHAIQSAPFPMLVSLGLVGAINKWSFPVVHSIAGAVVKSVASSSTAHSDPSIQGNANFIASCIGESIMYTGISIMPLISGGSIASGTYVTARRYGLDPLLAVFLGGGTGIISGLLTYSALMDSIILKYNTQKKAKN